MDESPAEKRLLIEEYKIWRKNVPSLYDLVLSHEFEWPSTTVEWLPDREEIPGEDCSVQKLILATHAPNDEKNHLILARLVLLLQDHPNHHRRDYLLPDSGLGFAVGKVEIVQQIIQAGEVNRARHMPQKPFIIATKTINEGDLNLFDYRKHPSMPPLEGTCDPDLILKGHSVEGFGLSWSPFKSGYLLSASDDICLWDINATPQNKVLNAMKRYNIHTGAVEEVAWHLKHKYLFGSVGDDQNLNMCDIRTPSVTKPVQSVLAHQLEVMCLAFNPFNEWVVATGSADTTVKLFDLRRLTNAFHTLHFHKERVSQVGWNPKVESVLASSCIGRRLLVWDVSRSDDKQTPADAEDEPPELLFTHAGHTNPISDLSWNPCEDWVVASVADDKILQIWKMAENTNHDEDD